MVKGQGGGRREEGGREGEAETGTGTGTKVEEGGA